jgi:hypothetical protein
VLSDSQVERYSRQIILPEVGGRGQERLLSATVSVIAEGALANLVVTYLSRAGIGKLRVSGNADVPLIATSPDCLMEIANPQDNSQSLPDVQVCIAMPEHSGHMPLLNAAIPLVGAAASHSSAATVLHIPTKGNACRNCIWRRLVGHAGIRTDVTPAVVWAAAQVGLRVVQTVLNLDDSVAGLLTRIDTTTMHVDAEAVSGYRDCMACAAA